MKLLIVSRLRSGETSEHALSRYLESPDRNPPPGVKRLGRWFSITFDMSWVVVETEDVKLVSQWLLHWAGSGTHEVIPVMDDADVVALLKVANPS